MTPDHFTAHQVVPGVHACVAGRSGAAVGNAAIIDAGTKTIVIDAFMTSAASTELAAVARRLTGRAPFLLVNTHWHGDHTRGNQTFAGMPIVATSQTVELIAANTPTDLDAYTAELDGYIETFTAQLESPDEAQRKTAQRRLGTLHHVRDSVPGFRLTLPNLLVDGKLVVQDERRVEILTYGGGHTDSDAFAWLPDDKLLVTGDLVFASIHPRIHDGHPAAWADILQRVLALGPTNLIPGHGRPGPVDHIEALIPYMRTVADMVAALGEGDPGELPVPPGSESWEGIDRFREGVGVLAARGA
ncbi:MAG: MBL fold metallo-hydrolase [Acidimicrobiia bacterium]